MGDTEAFYRTSMGPWFDNGRALFPNVADDDPRQFLLEAQLRGPAFGGQSFGELMSRVMGSRQLDLIERAANRGIVGNVLATNKRVAALDTFIRKHAEEIAKTPSVDHVELEGGAAQSLGKKTAERRPLASLETRVGYKV